MTLKNLNRRDFMKLMGATGLVLAAPVGLVPLVDASEGKHYSQSNLKMGTIVTLTIAGVSSTQAREAIDAAWVEMDRLIAIFDRHQGNTAVTELNGSGRLNQPDPELIEVMSQAGNIYRRSQGAFDPTILPLLAQLEKSFSATGNPPDRKDVEQAIQLVDFNSIRFDKQTVSFGRNGQQISLDGVAKGYIVDRAAEKLAEFGIKNALINAGGDIRAMGRRIDGRPWRVAVQDPFRSDKYLKVISLTDQAVATSGNYEVFYDKKKQYHHLLSPFKGIPAGQLVSATVIANNTAEADAWSTALFVSPGLADRSGMESMLVEPSGKQKATSGFRKMIS